MDYKALLEHSYSMELEGFHCAPRSRYEYLSRSIFQFVTYDSAIDDLFACKAVEACEAITNRATFEYIKDQKNYEWFLLMLNMPFFADKIDWGSSIRGAWWGIYDSEPYKFESLGLWIGDDQAEELEFSSDQWVDFMRAVVEFSRVFP